VPTDLAQFPNIYFHLGFLEPTFLRASSIFSQTLGTLKKKVGLAYFKVFTIDPFKASGLAIKIVAPK